jgi:hypothetical protein
MFKTLDLVIHELSLSNQNLQEDISQLRYCCFNCPKTVFKENLVTFRRCFYVPDFSGTVIIFTSDFDVTYPFVFLDKELVESSRLTQHIVGNWLHVSTVHAVTIMAVSFTRIIQILFSAYNYRRIALHFL